MQNLILWRGMLLLLLLVLVTTSAAVNSEKTVTYNRTQRSEANPAEYEGHLTSGRYDDYSVNDATEERLLTGKYEQFIDVTTEILPLTEDYSAFINVTTERIPFTEEHDGYSMNTTPMTGRPSTKKYDKKSIDVTTVRAPLTEEYSEYSVNAAREERLSIAENDTNWMEYDAEGRLPTEEYEWHTVDNITEVFLADDLPCPCPYIGACTNDSLGSTYQIKDVVKSSTVDNLTSAIDYVDHYECLVQHGYRRIALETVEELNFVVQCMLCNPKTLFGGSEVKKNIMTAGLVEVTQAGLWPHQVLETHATWKIWDETMDGSVPEEIVLLDPVTGAPVDVYEPLSEGTYSIFLVGDLSLHCDEGNKNYVKWGLMSHEAVGLEKLVGNVICERKDVVSTFTRTTNTADTAGSTFTNTSSTPEPSTSVSSSVSSPITETSTPLSSTTTEMSTTYSHTTSETTASSTSPPPTDTTTPITPSSSTSPSSTDTTTPITSSSTSPSSTDTTTPITTSSTTSPPPTDTTTPITTSSSTSPPPTDTTTPITPSSTSPPPTDTTTPITTSSSTSSPPTDTTTPITTSPSITSSITSTNSTIAPPTDTTSTTTTTTTTSTTTTTTTTTSTTTITTSTPSVPIKECCHLSSGDLLCPGSAQSESCPPGYSGFHRVICEHGEIKEIEDRCIADWINDVNSMINAGNTSVVDIADIVQNRTAKGSSITGTDLTCLVSIINNMTSLLEMEIANVTDGYAESTQELIQNYTTKLVRIEGNLFTYEAVWESLGKDNSSQLGSSLLHDLEKTGFILAAQVENDTLNFNDSLLNLTVLSRPRNELAGTELYFPGQSSDTFIRLPEDFENELDGTQGRVVGFFLDQGAASHALPAALNVLPNKMNPKEINGLLVSMTLGSLNQSVSFHEGSQVSLRFKHTYRESGPYYRDLYRDRREGEVPSRIPGSAACVYWDPSASTWVTNGCVLVNSSRDVTYCNCSHLSMISIITDVHQYMGRDIVLDVLGTVLSSLSCIFLLFAICILQFCKGVQSSPRISITKQLCVSLFLSHLFLIFFLDRDMLKLSNVGCEAMAGVLHYLLTASICWMLVEGLQLFHTVHFTLDPTSFMVVYWVIGYGVPAVVVLVTLLVAFGSCQWNTQDAYGDSEYCWLTAEEGYIWAFTGPLVVVIVANAIFMVCALRSAAILTANKRKSLHHRIMLYIKGSFSLNCVLGVTWVFGLLYINSNHFFAYVFTILNASQGVMIFVFNCVLNENVWTAFVSSLPATLRQRLMKRTSDKGLTSGRVTSGDCSTVKKPSSSPVHYHSNLHPSPRKSRPTHQALQVDNAHLTPLDSHHHNPVGRRRSQRDMTELDRSKQQFSMARDLQDSSTSRDYDRSQREEKWRYPPLTADVLSQAFTIVATSPCQLPRHSGHLPQKAIRRVSVPARVSLPDHRVSRRKESQWSAETQISFISDGKSSRKNSLDSSYTEGYNSSSPSSSASSSPSASYSSNLLSCLEHSLRIYPSHKETGNPHLAPSDDMQRCIHTIPECEERSSEKNIHFF